MIYVGVDPGQKGGLAALSDDGEVVDLAPIPLIDKAVDVYALADWLTGLTRDGLVGVRVMLEKAQAWPGRGRKRRCPNCGAEIRGAQGVASTAHYLKEYGVLLGVVRTLRLPVKEVHPATWKRVVLGQRKASEDLKARAVAHVCDTYPDVADTIYTGRNGRRLKRPRDGLAEALCIAEYAKRTWDK